MEEPTVIDRIRAAVAAVEEYQGDVGSSGGRAVALTRTKLQEAEMWWERAMNEADD